MSKKQKRPLIDESLHRPIQEFANKNVDGNFTLAVDILIRSALLANDMAEHKARKTA